MRPEYQLVRCKTALNRVKNMPFKWSLNPYSGCRHSCVYCFARQFYVVADHGQSGDFANRILVKENFADVLEAELRKPTWKFESVTLGTATDPYQPAEGRFRLTRRVLELLRDHANPMSMLTKSPLVQRDAHVLGELAERADVRVYFSITTLDAELWRVIEPGTAHPRYRLGALRALSEAGVPTGVLMAPVLPALTDSVQSIEAVAAAAAEHGASFFGAAALRLMPTVKEYYLEFVRETFPGLLERYQRAYPGVSAPRDYQRKLDERVKRVRARHTFRPDPYRAREAFAARLGAPLRATASGQLPLPLA